MTSSQPIVAARRTENIRYAVRDVVLTAREAAAAGKELLYLNIGDPLQFDFQTPPHIVDAICKALRDQHNGYTSSEGLPEAVAAIRNDAEARGIGVRDVYVGNGGSECIELALSALVNEGELHAPLLGMGYLERFARIQIERDRLTIIF